MLVPRDPMRYESDTQHTILEPKPEIRGCEGAVRLQGLREALCILVWGCCCRHTKCESGRHGAVVESGVELRVGGGLGVGGVTRPRRIRSIELTR